MRAAVSLLVPPALFGMFWLGRLFLRQDRIVFRPFGQVDRGPLLDLGYREVQLTDAAGAPPAAWWLPAAGRNRVVIYFHGSDGNVGRELGVARFLAGLGVSALLVEYPGYGGDGQRPSERGCYRAGEAAWEFLRGRGFAAEQVVLYGISLGAAVATYLASRRRCGGLVIQSGFTSVPDMAARIYPYLPVRPFCQTRMDNLSRIGDCTAPVLVIHSEDDEHIPIADARRLYRHAPGPKRFVAISGSHFAGSWRRHPEVVDAWRQLVNEQAGSWAERRSA